MNSVGFLEKLLGGAEVEWKRLGDVVRIKNGKDHKTLGKANFRYTAPVESCDMQTPTLTTSLQS